MGCLQSFFSSHKGPKIGSLRSVEENENKDSETDEISEGNKKTVVIEVSGTEEPESNDTSYGVEATAVRALAASTGTVAILGTTAKALSKEDDVNSQGDDDDDVFLRDDEAAPRTDTPSTDAPETVPVTDDFVSADPKKLLLSQSSDGTGEFPTSEEVPPEGLVDIEADGRSSVDSAVVDKLTETTKPVSTVPIITAMELKEDVLASMAQNNGLITSVLGGSVNDDSILVRNALEKLDAELNASDLDSSDGTSKNESSNSDENRTSDDTVIEMKEEPQVAQNYSDSDDKPLSDADITNQLNEGNNITSITIDAATPEEDDDSKELTDGSQVAIEEAKEINSDIVEEKDADSEESTFSKNEGIERNISESEGDNISLTNVESGATGNDIDMSLVEESVKQTESSNNIPLDAKDKESPQCSDSKSISSERLQTNSISDESISESYNKVIAEDPVPQTEIAAPEDGESDNVVNSTSNGNNNDADFRNDNEEITEDEVDRVTFASGEIDYELLKNVKMEVDAICEEAVIASERIEAKNKGVFPAVVSATGADLQDGVDDPSDNLNAAATKIQATFRGHLQRKKEEEVKGTPIVRSQPSKSRLQPGDS